MLRCIILVGLFLTSVAGYAQISSTFNTNAQGWTTPNDADGTIAYSATGGNPGGMVFGNPYVFVLGAGSLYIPFNFVAPGTYLGNRSTYYNGTLRYDIQQSTTGTPNQYAEVTIADNAGITLYYFPTTPNQPLAPPLWSTYSVVFNNTTGFWKTTNSPTGPVATETQIQSILSDLAVLEIRGLYRDANTTNRLDNVSFTPPIVVSIQPNAATVCNGVTATFTTAATGNPSITYRWQFESSPGVWTDLNNGGGYSNVTTATLTVNTTGNFGAGNYRCRISGTAVVDAFTNAALLTINALPTAPGTTGAARCGTGTVTLTASGGVAGQYRWYTVPTGGTAIAGQTNATYLTPSLTITTPYYVAINNGTCESNRTAVTATINTIPGPPSTTGASACGNSSVTLTATGASAGQYRWYTLPIGGTAVAGETNATYITPTLTGTTNYYVSINNGFCESTRTIVTATINTLPTAPTTTGASRCGSGSVTLTAAGGTAGQYRWYTVPTGGTAIAGETGATYVTPTLTGTTNYYVAINNGICESTRTIVTATINTLPTAPTTTGASRCGSGSVTLTAAGGTAGQYRWYTVPTGGTAIAGQTAATYVTPSLTGTTNYYVSINNGFCESVRTIVTATINTIPTAPTTTGASRCGNGSVTLNASGGTAGQYRWYNVPTGGTAIAGETNTTYATPTLTGTTNYYVAINNGICESTRTIVTATINPIPPAPTTTGASRCGNGSVTLNASGGAAGQYRWYTVPTGGTAIAGETNATYVTPSLTGTTDYYVSINNGTCESNRTIVTATITTIPAAPATTGGANCGTGTVTLNASGGTAGQYRWYTVATGGTAIAGQTNNTFVTPVISSTTTYYVSINNGACEGARSAVVATINPIPAAPTTTGSSSCIAASLTLSAAGGTAGQYRWYTVATGGTALAGQTSATYLTPLLALTTTFYVSINDGTCESVRTAVIATINFSPTPPTTTGASSCGSSALTLSAAGGAAGQYRWYTVPTGGTAIAGQTNSTLITPLLTTTTTFYVAINNTLCESTRTPAVATINTIPGIPTVTGAARCGTGTVTLNAAGATAGQYRWYTLPTGGTAITGQTSSSYTTPSINATTPYYVAINNGLCESPRILVNATINTVPNAPTTTGAISCPAASVTLSAAGGVAGQYRWYTVATGGTAIAGQTNSTFTTPVLSSTTTYYVAINDGTCESLRAPVIATIAEPGCDNVPPVITTEPLVTQVKGVVTISLVSLITDGNDNVDLSTLRIITPPASGALTSIDASFNLVIDYSSLTFSGTENVTIEVCDIYAACTQQTFTIEVVGKINVFNAISPNNDGDNEIFEISYIDALENTFENKVSIFNRWGTLVWEGINYNNVDVVFKGLSNSGNELPSGTYFYKIEFKSGLKTESGYLVLKR